jgi:HPt (histidine-containing phosphotransfer) domain-containing protein
MTGPRSGQPPQMGQGQVEALIDLLALRGIVDDAIRAHVEQRGAVALRGEHRRFAEQVRVLAATILEANADLEAAERSEPGPARNARRPHPERFGDKDGEAIEAALAQFEKDLGAQSVRRLCEIFLEDVEGRLVRLANAIRDHDFAMIRTQAHAIKGSVANFHAREAVDAAQALEAAPDGPRLPEEYARLERAIVWLRHRVRAYCALLAS